MKIIKFRRLHSATCNRVARGDKLDNSIEHTLKTTGFEHFLVSKLPGGRFMVCGGELVTPAVEAESVAASSPPKPKPKKAGRPKKDAKK